MEIHDELAAQIQNSTEAVEYIDGVSSIAEEDDEKSTLTSIQEEREFDIDGEEKNPEDEEEEVQIDTFRVIGIRRSPGECLVSDCFLGFSFLQSKNEFSVNHSFCNFSPRKKSKNGNKFHFFKREL